MSFKDSDSRGSIVSIDALVNSKNSLCLSIDPYGTLAIGSSYDKDSLITISTLGRPKWSFQASSRKRKVEEIERTRCACRMF